MGTQRVHKEVNLDLMARHAGLGNANTAQLREFARMVSQAEREMCIEAIRGVRETYATDPAEKDVQIALDWAASKITARGIRWDE